LSPRDHDPALALEVWEERLEFFDGDRVLGGADLDDESRRIVPCPRDGTQDRCTAIRREVGEPSAEDT
jgi:hypothetical protein